MFFWAHYHGAPTVPSLNPARQVALRWSGANGMHQHINKPSRTHVCILYIYMYACVCFTDFTATPTVDIQSQSTTCTNMKHHETIYIEELWRSDPWAGLVPAIGHHHTWDQRGKAVPEGLPVVPCCPNGLPTAPENSWKIHGMWMKYDMKEIDRLGGSHRISEVPNMFCMANFNSAGDCCHLGHPPFSQSMMDNSDLVQHFAFTTATLW